MPKGKIEASADMWRDRVHRWKESGLSAREFAAREGIARHGALSWWAHRLSRQESKTGSGRNAAQRKLRIVQLPVSAMALQSAAVEVLMPGGARLLVTANTDVGALQRVLQVLEVRS